MNAEDNIQYKTIFESAKEGYVLLDTSLRIQAINTSASKLIFSNTGSSNIELGASVFDFVDKERISALNEVFNKVRAGETVEYDHAYRSADGKTSWNHFSFRPLYTDGKVTGIFISGEEITPRKIAEQQEALLVSIINSSEYAIVSTDLQGNITSWNRGATQMLGYTGEQVMGKHISLLSVPEGKHELASLMARVKQGEAVRQWDARRLTKDGRLIDISLSLSVMKDANGTPTGMAAIARDVTEMRKTQQALKESEGFFRYLFENSPLPKLVARQSDLKLLKVNQMAIQHYGYSEQELLSMSAFDVRIAEEHSDLLRIISEGGDVVKNKIVRHRKKNGEVIFVQIALYGIEYNSEPCYLVLVNDLTDQLRVQKELAEERLRLQKEITNATIEGQEKQRAEIGKELHDNVNQMLASVKMYLSSFQDGTERQQELIRRSVETLGSCMDEIRQLSRSLVPSSLGDIGLTEAVEELLQHFSDAQSGIRFTSHISFDEKQISLGLQLSVYRIIQEQFSNIIKYAGASQVAVHLKQFDHRLLVEVADDGRGFDTSQKRKGIGITNMMNRAELYNGKFNIVSSPGNGCVVTVEFYLQN